MPSPPDDYSTSAPVVQDNAAVADIKRSKKVTKRRRRTLKKDRETIAITRVLMPSGTMGAPMPSVTIKTPRSAHPSPLPTTLPSSPVHIITTTTVKTPGKFVMPVYAHTTYVGQVTFANRALAVANTPAYAFTLNLSPKQIAAANDNAKGFTDYFTRRLGRGLKLIGHHERVWFSVDVAGG